MAKDNEVGVGGRSVLTHRVKCELESMSVYPSMVEPKVFDLRRIHYWLWSLAQPLSERRQGLVLFGSTYGVSL